MLREVLRKNSKNTLERNNKNYSKRKKYFSKKKKNYSESNQKYSENKKSPADEAGDFFLSNGNVEATLLHLVFYIATTFLAHVSQHL